jgi:hypothetical protein
MQGLQGKCWTDHQVKRGLSSDGQTIVSEAPMDYARSYMHATASD